MINEDKAIIFDLDGTLVHTAPDVALALNATLSSYHLSPIPDQQIYKLMGYGAKYMLNQAFVDQNKILSVEELQTALHKYLTNYQENPIVKTTIYPGVLSTLKSLQEQGYKLGVCTNKPNVISRIILKKLKLNDFFGSIVCGDEIALPKPNAHHVQLILDELAVSASQSVLVGDSNIDELAAKNAGVAFVGVRYGYGLEDFSPKTMIEHFSELLNMLSGSMVINIGSNVI